MSVNLSEGYLNETCHYFWACGARYKGAPVSYCLAMLKHQTVEYFGADLTLGSKGIDNFYASL
jgi:hypothetical protein